MSWQHKLMRVVKRHEGDVHSGKIRGGLGQHAFAIVMDSRLDEVAVVLLDQALAALIEGLPIGIGPPIDRPALQIIGGAQRIDKVR